MKLTFFETPAFTRHLRGYLDDESYQDLQNALMEDPKRGDVIPGTGGFRKLRWEDRRRGKGKRSGLRLIYYHLEDSAQMGMFTLYDKDQAADLTTEQKRVMKLAIEKEKQARARR